VEACQRRPVVQQETVQARPETRLEDQSGSDTDLRGHRTEDIRLVGTDHAGGSLVVVAAGVVGLVEHRPAEAGTVVPIAQTVSASVGGGGCRKSSA
jgi:hypothetical protein